MQIIDHILRRYGLSPQYSDLLTAESYPSGSGYSNGSNTPQSSYQGSSGNSSPSFDQHGQRVAEWSHSTESLQEGVSLPNQYYR
jgi:hypothetical protein